MKLTGKQTTYIIECAQINTLNWQKVLGVERVPVPLRLQASRNKVLANHVQMQMIHTRLGVKSNPII